MFICPGVFADLVDIAGAHGDQEVTGLAVFQKVVFDFIEGWGSIHREFPVPGFFFEGRRKRCRGCRFLLRRRCLPVLHGLPESVLRRIREQSFGTGVGMWLEDTPGLFCVDSFWQRSVLL